jgi:two-component sensor histidine kinase
MHDDDRQQNTALRKQISENSAAVAVHEVCTNAAKYGALSNDRGRVKIDSEVDILSERRLRGRWEEIDGPEVEAPRRQGFGSRSAGARSLPRSGRASRALVCL